MTGKNKNISAMLMVSFLLEVIFMSMFSGCSKAQSSSTAKSTALKDQNILIVYLSRTKNTKAIAEIIQKNVGGKLVSLELEKPYPENYKAIVDQVASENTNGYMPPLKTKVDSIEKYDIIFIGFPTWGMQLPPPMKSFLRQYNFKGKTLVPFNTNAGYGIGSTFQTVKDMASSSTILEGFSIQGGKERDGIYFVMKGEKEKEAQTEVLRWLQKIELIK